MKRSNLLIAVISFAILVVSVVCLSPGRVQAQTLPEELPNFEVGVHFTSITKPAFNGGSTEPGVGARFTFNFNRNVAFEAEGNYFPHSCRFCGRNLGDSSGIMEQGLFGIKAGKRFDKWGIFAKARPGVVRFGQGQTIYTINGTGPSASVHVQRQGQSHFATDLGAVLEFYPSKRIVTRFDLGDTLIHYGSRQSNFLIFDATNSPILMPFTTRSETRHNFQFAAGVGWRF